MSFLSSLDSSTRALFIFVSFIVIGLLLTKLILNIRDFCDELNLINKEIQRTTGREREHWERRRRRLWLSCLPFYRYYP